MWSLRAAAVVAAVGTRSLEPRRLGASRCRGVEAALASGPFCSRALHVSAARCGSRNLLKKFLSKKKKKFWYDSPSLDSQMLYKPSSLTSIVKTAASPKTKKEDSLRKRTLDVLLYKAVTDMLNTCEVSQEAYDLRVELTKASTKGTIITIVLLD
uniref:RBFA factor n=1 Tax=Sphenodon punctatus TaxID=8508 RepID=A0A8D0GNV3_SPHPU